MYVENERARRERGIESEREAYTQRKWHGIYVGGVMLCVMRAYYLIKENK